MAARPDLGLDWLPLQGQPQHIAAVSIAPLFLAALTSGQASEQDLGRDLYQVRYELRTLKEFAKYEWFKPVYNTATGFTCFAGNTLP